MNPIGKNIVLQRISPVLVGVTALICLALYPSCSWALRCFILSPGKTVYGTARWVRVNEKDTLLDIARDLGLGYNQITAANPGIDPWVPPKDSLVFGPSAFVLPKERSRAGIVVNLAEMRLYYFFSNGGHDYFLTAPIGVGREGFLTQLGTYTVKSKTANPTWVVPESIRKEDPELPAQVPPGPDNPLGDYVFRLSERLYAIHGTNKPWGIGRRVSHGCIRMYPEDVAALYPLVAVGTVVQVIYEPIKFGWAEGKCWIQVFDDFDDRNGNPLSMVMAELSKQETATGGLDVDFKALFKALKEKNGVPVAVARLAPE
jgi:L,D-transpeptidase ErfK/SrfK